MHEEMILDLKGLPLPLAVEHDLNVFVSSRSSRYNIRAFTPHCSSLLANAIEFCGLKKGFPGYPGKPSLG